MKRVGVFERIKIDVIDGFVGVELKTLSLNVEYNDDVEEVNGGIVEALILVYVMLVE